MTDYRSKTVLVVDNGLFVEFAITLAQSFGRVLYWTPWESAFPKSNAQLPGMGVPQIERVNAIWDVIDYVDLVVFPYVYHGSLQEHLVAMGKRVWGGRRGEELELDRVASKELCASLGIDIGPFEVVTGLDALRDYLRDNDDQWVKISATRGDFETFHAINYRLIEPLLDQLEWSLGEKKRITRFIVEQGINEAIETGYDGFTVDGRFPRQAMFGFEIKDRGYVLECVPYRSLPWQVRSVNDKLSPALRDYQYRGFISTEVRATTDKAYLIDPCCRLGSPPGEMLNVLVTNWPDILWEGAEGTLVEPQCAGKFGAELLIHSAWADKNWQAIEFPKAIRDFVKLRNLTIINGRYYVVPQAVGLPEIGAVVAVADTLDGAIRKVKKYAEQVEGYFVTTMQDAMDAAVDENDKLRGLS